MLELIYGFIFILIAVVLSIKEKIGLEREILYAAFLALIQLIMLGYVLTYVFQYGDMILTYVILLIMVLTATYIVNSKVSNKINGSSSKMFLYIFLTLLTVTLFTLTIWRLSYIVPYKPRYIIPLMGMIVGNSMNTVHLALDKVIDHIKSNRDMLWGYLALGASEFQALKPFMKVAITSAVIPKMNMTKSVGIIFIPGTMTGMLLSGADPLYAAKIQVIIMWMLLGTAVLSGVILCYLSYRELIRI
ncbi:MAG TPA: iron export ABC transporter permease subunit FetB [Methanothermococcus okinawensis]|uniref:Iron export ABC transporter permease subunit FetB n=1 Tax=Methanothermococcus okinawensis TaxID=155863 RepID=A0A832ZJX3_9EURY|nr:iron export ABC transporter permease subunit FetB [Methanococcaceae archaeon]HIP84771.1 iron export ABC transporter permease subunit FetB [Methanothermococcus okinawensis]HIP91233.1 iron export ABC transporter permease subunit FetB [Methanothermococcus okinawensis]